MINYFTTTNFYLVIPLAVADFNYCFMYVVDIEFYGKVNNLNIFQIQHYKKVYEYNN